MPRYPTEGYRRNGGSPTGRSNEGFLGPPPAPVLAPPTAPPPPPPAIPPVAPVPPIGLLGLGALTGLGLGLWLGYQVAKDIWRWEDNAWMPPEDWGPWNDIDLDLWTPQTYPFGYVLCSNQPKAAPVMPNYCGERWQNATGCVPSNPGWTSQVAGDCSTFASGWFVTGAPPYILRGQREWTTLSNGSHLKHDQWFQGWRKVATLTNAGLVPGYYAPPAEWEFPEELPIMQPAVQPTKPPPARSPDPWEEPSDPEKEPDAPSPSPSPLPRVFPLPLFPFPVVTYPGWIYPPPGVGHPIVVVPPDVIVEPGPGPGPGPGDTPTPSKDPKPGPYPRPMPRPGPGPSPEPEPGPGPGGGGVIITRPGNPTARQPRKNTKERKVTVRTVSGRLWAALNLFTEGLDFVDVLWESIPKEDRTQPRRNPRTGEVYPVGVDDRLWDIYDHWDEIDIAVALENFINNQVEDFVYGQAGMATGRATGGLGITTGLNRALRDQQGNISDLQEETESPTPQLNYDQDTGAWSLVWEPMGWNIPLARGSGVEMNRRLGDLTPP